METGILAGVGTSGRNNDIDVETIQKLLNRVPLPIGPPFPVLAEDGDCGPLTIAAIHRFQTRVLAGFSDGLIEPNRNTHQKLSELAGGVPDVPSRAELAEGMIPFVHPMVLESIAALETLQKNPEGPGPRLNLTREALKVHFLLDDGRDDHIGRVIHRFQGIRVDFDHRNIFWRSATMKRAKIELNQRNGARVPAIYNSFLSGSAFGSMVFTPNYKAFDPRDSMGYGPQMLGYRLLAGIANHVIAPQPNESVIESDTPGFPGTDFFVAVHNPPSYGSFAFHLRLGFAQPLGELNRAF